MKLTDIEFIDFSNRHPNTVYCNRQPVAEKNLHRHSYYEIEIIAKGNGMHHINGNAYPSRTGDVCIMRLTDFHEFRPKFTQSKIWSEHWVIEIPPSFVSQKLAKLMMSIAGDIFVHTNKDDFEKVKNIFYLVEEIKDKNETFHNMMKKDLVSFLILFIIERVNKEMSKNYHGEHDRIRSIVEYIENNFSSQELTVDLIAKHFFINKSYLSTLFKKNMGITLIAYLRKIRLSNAALLIIETDKKIVDISEETGFNSISTFLRDFKKEYGISPKEMRKRNILDKKQ